jgi:arylsulfatase A-like enzyme
LIVEAWKCEAVDFDEEQPDKYASDALYAVTVPYYAYQHVDLVTGHGDQCGGNYEQWFRANCPDWKALTAGMVTMIDDQVGRMVAALKEAGLFENTIVIFNSDHGDYLGDFDLLLKGALPFRSVTQVPMIWSDPMQQTVARTQALASTIDISASILARAGLALTTEYRVAVFRTVWRRMYRTVMRCW